MFNFDKITIKKVIVHVLDNHKDQIELSERECDLDKDIKNWLVSHIANAMREERIRAAGFDSSIANNLVKQNITKVFNNINIFVKCSQSLAEYLFQFMKRDQRISPGDLVIVVFSEQGDADFHVAVLKMDPQKVVTHEMIDKEGVEYINLILRGEGLPNPQQRLQKAVLFINPRKEFEYEMIVLDNQIALLEKEGRVANFFAGQFLGCTLSLTARERTINIYKYTKEFIENSFPPSAAFTLSTNLDDIIKGSQHVNLKEFSRQLFQKRSVQNNFYSYLDQKEFVDREFDIDREWVEKHLKKREIKTKEGIRIVGTTVNFKEHVRIKQKVGNKADIIIENITYSEKLPR